MARLRMPQPLRLLIIDEERLRKDLEALLKPWPELRAIAEVSPEETGRSIEQDPPHVLLIGTFPPQRAMEVLDQLRGPLVHRRPLAIAHVARHCDPEWARWHALGFDDYVMKELRLDTTVAELLGVIDRAGVGTRLNHLG